MRRIWIEPAFVLIAFSACRAAPCPESWVEPVSSIEFRRLPIGNHRIGSPDSEKDRETQEVPHSVRLDRCVGLSTTEVTHAQWKTVLGEAPSHFSACGSTCPVESVTLHDVERLLERLRVLAPAVGMRLPTEAEWEIACRSGSAAAFSVGDELAATAANFDRTAPTPVGTFPPNAWGFFDLHGNVWEWTADEHCPYPPGTSSASQPLRCGAEFHVIRGGSWHFGPDSARCALRYTHRPRDRGPSLGVRLASEPIR
jgi:formylglycine-generating enzyme required for sulfatase activity